MTDKVNGKPLKGFWGERDVTWVKVDVGSPVIGEPTAVGGNLDAVINVLETRGTVLGFFADSELPDQVIHVAFGHAAGYFGVGTPPVEPIPANPDAVPPTALIPGVAGKNPTATALEAVAPVPPATTSETTVTLENGATKVLGELAKAIQELEGGFLGPVVLTVGYGFATATFSATAPV